MKLTPLDIHHKEFGRAIRGYNEAEVDEFLDKVADELERLFKENIDLNERLEAAEERLRGFQDMERTLHNTMISAQKSAEDIIGGAHRESEVVLRDAEVKAKEIVHSALQLKQKSQSELVRIKQAEEDFRSAFKALLEKHLGALKPVPLPADIQVLTGDAAGEKMSDVDVAEEPEATLDLGTPPEFEPIPEPEEIEPVDEPAIEEAEVDEPAVEEAEAEQSASAKKSARSSKRAKDRPVTTVVESVHLGEVASPDLPDAEPTLEVKEFT
ncbi:MAG TPA: DivIVA domain-containing protein, partial [Coriobacteriia bacterium]|nr:DivIVA domain-containing protein [Coriobacteriia bacterium]